jgi:arylsulfatase A-like enzyme
VSGFTLRPELNLDQGFEEYSAPVGRNRTGAATRRQAEAWWDTVADDERLFLWFHSFDPHGPLGRWGGRGTPDRWRQDPAEQLHLPRYQRLGTVSDDRFYAHRYARAVRATDGEVGLLLDRLRDQGRYDDALIIFHADHGESFTERNLWFDHGFGAYAEQLHIPLVVKLPGNARAGEVVDRLVTLEDILPTVLEVGDMWGLGAVDGLSLLGDAVPGRVLVGESSHCKKNLLFSCRPEGPRGKQIVARDGEHTVLQVPIVGGEMATAVYAAGAEPDERTPRQIAPPAHLLAAIAPVRAQRDAITLTVPTAPSPQQRAQDPEADAELEALRALGYVDE